MQFGFTILVYFAVMAATIPALLPVLLVSLVIYNAQMGLTNRVVQQTKRMTNAALAPLISNIEETRRGRALISVSGLQPFFAARQHAAADAYNRSLYMCEIKIT